MCKAGRGDLAIAVEDGAVIHRRMLELEHRHLLATGREWQRGHGALDQTDVGRWAGHQCHALLGQLAPAEALVENAQTAECFAHGGNAAAAGGDGLGGDLRRAADKQRSGMREPVQTVDAAQSIHEFRGTLRVELAVDGAGHFRRKIQRQTEAAGEVAEHGMHGLVVGVVAVRRFCPGRW